MPSADHPRERRTILVVDDDRHLREVVRYALERAGFDVEEAADGAAALQRFDAAGARPLDLLVLDVSMPELDGLSLCRALRARSDVPILFLSSRADEIDRVLGLELGGDDYMTKPFSTRELVTRVKVILRRPRTLERDGGAAAPPVATAADEDALERGPLRLSRASHRAWARGHEVALTATELRILEVLMRRPGRVYSRDELARLAYPDDRHVSTRTLDSHIRRIRSKLRRHDVLAIDTVHGVGYRLGDALARGEAG